ncbi:MAG: hypothetical protein WBJ75_06610 [Pseudohongiellaceae bacterium]
MNSLSRWLISRTSRMSLLISFGITIIIAALMYSSLPMTNSALLAVSGENILDITFYYQPGEAMRRMEAYGEEGRSIYLGFEMLDFPFIPAYTLALAFLLSWLIGKSRAAEDSLHSSLRSRLNLLPLLIGAADLVENSCVVMLLTLHPDAPILFAAVASSATLFKHLFIGATLAAVGFCAFKAVRAL